MKPPIFPEMQIFPPYSTICCRESFTLVRSFLPEQGLLACPLITELSLLIAVGPNRWQSVLFSYGPSPPRALPSSPLPPNRKNGTENLSPPFWYGLRLSQPFFSPRTLFPNSQLLDLVYRVFPLHFRFFSVRSFRRHRFDDGGAAGSHLPRPPPFFFLL